MIRIKGRIEKTGCRRRYGLLIAFLGISLLVIGTVAPAGSQEILPINPVPDLVEPPQFDFRGQLDRLSDEDIVVSDTHMALSIDETVTYHRSDGSALASSSSLKIGDWVGCFFDDFNRVKAVWKLDGPIE